jgi:hypothetical protein
MSSLPQDVINSLAKEGFPEKVSNAFQKAADELNCVILSRVPGKACTTMIDEGYNLKPFYIHGKSCNWGPMAGFVCQLPALNKAGTSSMDFNLKEHLSSLKWLKDKQNENLKEVKIELLKIKDRNLFNAKFEEVINYTPSPLSLLSTPEDLLKTMEFLELKTPSIASSLFLPLTISDARKAHLIEAKYLGEENKDYKLLDDGSIIGIATDNNRTVVVEYKMEKRQLDENPVWDIYHRNIYTKNESDGSYTRYVKKLENGFDIQNQLGTEEGQTRIYNEAIKNYNLTIENLIKDVTPIKVQIKVLLANNSIMITPDQPGEIDKWYPLNGLQSPYLVYKEEKDRYKNAVSGDYDLFAVWPLVPGTGLEMTTRISERKSQKSPNDEIQNLFILVEAKNYALEITKSRNVFIEFIGSFEELKGKEDPETGNISELVFNTAQMINSLVHATYMKVDANEKIDKDKKIDTVEPDQYKKGSFPSRAFHSDEGGRPQVNEIEYSIAFFMPESQWSGLKSVDLKATPILESTAGLVQSHVEFLSLILLLRKRFYVFLHDGWVMHLMCLAAGKKEIDELTNLSEKPQKYFKARVKEMNDLGDSLAKIQSLLKELLTFPPSPNNQALLPAYSKAFEDVMGFFIKFASQEPPYSSDARIVKMLSTKLDLTIPKEKPDVT